MDRWMGKIAVVTGASAGIGANLLRCLLDNGLKVVALARRGNVLKEIQNNLPSHLKDNFYPFECDINRKDEVKTAFKWIEDTLHEVHILVNNAGMSRYSPLASVSGFTEAEDIININTKAVIYCTAYTIEIMRRNQIPGHIVVITGITGKKVPNIPGITFSSFEASKHATTTVGLLCDMCDTYRKELVGTGIKVTVRFSPILITFIKFY